MTGPQVANLPHVDIQFSQRKGAKPAAHSRMFMIDSGAGGVDAMFHTRAATELGLVDANSNSYRYIKVWRAKTCIAAAH
jgi:hypothetical protein